MSLAIVHSRAQCGVDAPPVQVEVHLSGGLPGMSIVGNHYMAPVDTLPLQGIVVTWVLLLSRRRLRSATGGQQPVTGTKRPSTGAQ